VAIERLALTTDEHAVLVKIERDFPGLVAAIEASVQRLVGEALSAFQGLVMTERGVDYLLGELVERVVAQGTAHAELELADEVCGAMTLLVARHAVARSREDMMRRLVVVKRN
jgi:hypothetical protein